MTRLFAAVVMLVGLAGACGADTIKVVVPFAAGGPVDTLARLLSSDMQTRLNTEMVIENRGGAGGVLATELVARAPADGKTLLFASSGSHVISAALRAGQLSYDPVKSFAPIGFAGAVPMLVVVSADYPAKTLAELIAKAKTDKLSYASAGAGSTMHIIGELINAEAGIKTTHVPYKGVAPALNDLLGGHVQHPTWQVRMYAARAAAIGNEVTALERLAYDPEDNVWLGTMMLALGEVSGLVSGAIHSTANTIRPALQVIKM